MKLTGLHIENFGCLHQYDLKFGDGLTVIREPNGFGKTTLAEFIRAMFYGFPRAAKTLDKNKRKKYLPWSGGKCGGHLTFELEGNAYRIERTFGATPRGDSFSLIDLSTNQKSTRFSEEIGVELFQLDADSFERSTYMPQFHETGALTTDSIRAKLGDLVEDTNDINNFDKAVKALKEKRSAYVPYRGSGGSVAEARTMVSRIQEELVRAESRQEELEGVQEESRTLEEQLERDNGELAGLRDRITSASQAAAAASLRQQYDNLLLQQQKAREVAEMAVFANGIPSGEELAEAAEVLEWYQTLMAQAREGSLSDGERRQLEELRAFFAPGIPDNEGMETLARQQREVLRLGTLAESRKLSDEEQQRLEDLQRRFHRGLPEETELDAHAAALDRAAALRQENQRLGADIPEKSGGKGSVIMLILAVLALAAGIGFVIAQNFLIGGILLGGGLLALLIAAMFGKKQSDLRELRQKLADNESEAAALEEKVRAFAGNYSKEKSLGEALREIRNSRSAYLTLTARRKEMENSRIEVLRELDGCKAGLRQALTPYFGNVQDFEEAILQLQLKRSRLVDLMTKNIAAEVTAKRLRAEGAELEQKLLTFLKPYYPEATPEQLRSLLTRLEREREEYLRAWGRLAELEEQTAAFRAEHGPALETAAEEIPDLEELKRTERELALGITDRTRQLLEHRQRAARLREELDRIPELRDELETWRSRKEEDQKKSDTLDLTLEYLQQAKESLSGNYLGTIQRSFGEYLGRLTGEDREKILVTGDLEVLLERQGLTRELGYFSAGQADMVMLCMRFALVDALFGDVKPFVILDDPFVNLDDERTAQALELLRDLAKDRQILYLVCNSSRM